MVWVPAWSMVTVRVAPAARVVGLLAGVSPTALDVQPTVPVDPEVNVIAHANVEPVFKIVYVAPTVRLTGMLVRPPTVLHGALLSAASATGACATTAPTTTAPARIPETNRATNPYALRFIGLPFSRSLLSFRTLGESVKGTVTYAHARQIEGRPLICGIGEGEASSAKDSAGLTRLSS